MRSPFTHIMLTSLIMSHYKRTILHLAILHSYERYGDSLICLLGAKNV